uniref:Cadherin domain-containing protein n=1 Tax=Haemonchus contortus TaxID=6289 RepID=A0A7I4YRT8_HAECO
QKSLPLPLPLPIETETDTNEPTQQSSHEQVEAFESSKQSLSELSEDIGLLPEAHISETFTKSRTKLPTNTTTVDIHNNGTVTRFEKCEISVSMPENSEAGTLVTILNVLNRKKWTMIDMVNPDGTFEIRQKTGEVFVRDNRIMDRELFTNLELVAEIHGSSHLTKCARTRVNVELLDQNDNRPTFEKEKYVFLLSDEFPPEGVIGVVRARDIDEGEAGHVSYSLLNTSVPFEIRPKGKDAELVATSDFNATQQEFRLIIVARDNAPPFLSSEIPVDILIPKSMLKSSEDDTMNPSRINGVVSATGEPPLLLQGTTLGERITSAFPLTTSTEPSTPFRPQSTTTSSRVTPTRRLTTTTKLLHPTLITAEELDTEREKTSTTSGSNEIEEEYTDDSTEDEEEEEGSTAVTAAAERSTMVTVTEEESTTITTKKPAVTTRKPAVTIRKVEEALPFGFVQPSYYYEVFGPPQKGDILGRVEAAPNNQFYGIDRKMSGIFKIEPDLGEISVGPHMDRLGDGNHTFEVSATNGTRTVNTVVTVRLDSKRSRTDGVPRFERNRYVFTIPENKPPSVVGVVRAYHVALSSSDILLQYEILPGSFGDSLPFRVHPISGEITSESVLDYETNKNYEFKIRACLSVNPGTCGYTSVVVIVKDENDNAPRFSASQFHLSLPSDLPVGSDVITLQATDADSGLNGDVNYAINPPSAVFGIDYHTGVVQTTAPLTESHYDLNIEAFDHGDPKQIAIARLRIAVHGTNPSAPVFDQKRYDVTLESPIRAGAVVAELHAKDPDPGMEGQITYRFDQSEDQLKQDRKFSINEQTGVVSALTPLTPQDGPFDLVVIAEDQSPVFKRKASAVLHIEIVGDTSLRFLPLPSTIYISTEKAVGSVVLRASAFTSSSLPVHFRILENESQFVMDGDLLRVANHLSSGETHLTIRAESDNAFSDHQLRVVVMFDRDKYPVFPQLTYDIDIPIDSQFPVVVHRFDARLLNGTLRYRFFPDGTAPEGLYIDSRTGELSATASYAQTPANHETQFVVVRAVNVDYPEFYSDVGVAISLVSSRSLHFPQSIYRLQINENVPIGTTIFPPIEVFPKSTTVEYSITPSTPLSILPNGTLVVNALVDLEQLPVDQADSLHFVVTAKVGEYQAFTKIQLKVKDINEFAPQFDKPQYDVSLSESSAPGSTIVQVKATDADKTDGKHLLYKVVGGSGRDLVFIQEDGTLILGDTPLNREDMNRFDVVVEAIDRSGNKDTTTVVITVEDVNDNAPMFPWPSFTWNITEGSPGATLDVTASDNDTGLNGDLEYQIVQGNEGNHFAIEKTSSNRAVLRLVLPLDYELRKIFKLTIEAKDQGVPPHVAITTIIVNVLNTNDNPPVFQRANIEQEVSADLPVGYPILTLTASDADHDRLSYSLTGDPLCSSLAVDPMGIVSFKTPAPRRKPGLITCVVSATDGVFTANATLRLNIFEGGQPTRETPAENHAPRFAKEVYTVTVTPNKKNHVLKKITATDPDGDVLIYSIEPPEFRNLFAVDAEGQLSVRVPISELKQSLYSFLIVAEDRGKPIMSTFTNIRVRVQDNEVTAVTSNSLEGTYSTESAQTTSPMPTAGEYSPGSENLLDTTSTQEMHSTSASITTDGFESTSLTTSVAPAEVHFTRPKYSYAIRSDAQVGTYLGRVTVDNREGVELAFKTTKLFYIDSHGAIRTAVVFSSPMKVEDKILAIRKGATVAETDFVVHVIAAETTTSPTTQGVTGDTEVTLITGTRITSASTEPNRETQWTHYPTTATVEEETESPSVATATTVEETVPWTTLQTTVDVYESTFTAGTAGTQGAAATRDFTAGTEPSPSTTFYPPTPPSTPPRYTITEEPVSSVQPTTSNTAFSFSRPMYFAFVPEGQYSNGIRLSVKPEPFSVNRNTAVRYEIDQSAGHIPFFLTADGQLIIFDVDREQQASYSFPIKATSPEYGTATAMVNVTILDVNDNYPVFDAAPSAIGVFSDVAVGTPLFHFSAHDSDADNYGTVVYGIEESDAPFEIDPNGGTLFVAKPLVSNLVTEFPITVFARDNGRPSLKSTHKITIHVFDPSAEQPIFPNELPERVVFVGTQPGTEIATILAGPTITTKPTQDKILYGLDDDYNGLFAIEDGGRLILARRATAAESDRYIQLNITAENSHGKAWVLLKVFVEGQPTTPVSGSVTQSTAIPSGCYFPTKVYNAEIMENRQGRIRVAKVTSSCESDGRPYLYTMSPVSDDFELNPTTGEIFAVRPLDREKRSFHFLYVSVSGGIAAGGRRVTRQNPIIEQAMSKLTESQTLVAVRVLDENDNAPQFVHVNEDESLAAVVDWQARLFSPVLKLEAKDADERAKLYYSLSGTDQEYFLVNATSGLVILAKTLAEFSGDSLEFRATVTDGVHNAHVPIKVYVISPSSSLVQLTAEVPHSLVDQQSVERILNELTGLDNHLLAKQPFVDSVGHADPKRSHLFVYALDRKTKQPIPKEELAKMLESHSATLLSSPTRISDIAMLSPPPVSISTFDIVLAIICIILFLLLLAACCILSSYCKRRKRAVATSDREYMVSGKAGPRPYDVEIISRTTAQRVLSARQLPEPMTNQIEVAVSPIFMDSTMTTNKSDTTQDFSNSVRERPSLLQSALARQKVHAAASKPAQSSQN